MVVPLCVSALAGLLALGYSRDWALSRSPSSGFSRAPVDGTWSSGEGTCRPARADDLAQNRGRSTEASLSAEQARIAELQVFLTAALDTARMTLQMNPNVPLEAQSRARELMRSFSFSDEGYIYVYDATDGKLIAHPHLQSLEGKHPELPVVEQLIDCAKRHPDGGLLTYDWPRPWSTEPVPKQGLVVLFEPWNWVIGTGFYSTLAHDPLAKQMGEARVPWLSVTVFFIVWAAITLTDLWRWATFKKAHTRAVMGLESLERQRLSQELHDGLLQLLSSARMRLGVLSDELARRAHPGEDPLSPHLKEAREVFQLVDSAARETRAIAEANSPVALQDHGLLGALRRITASIHRDYGIQAEFITNADQVDVSAEVEATAYRVVQEALWNVIKHAQAQHVSVRLTRAHRFIELTVQDDGIGFAARPNVALGLGRRNMETRVQQAGGSLEVTATAKGTRVMARLPERHLRWLVRQLQPFSKALKRPTIQEQPDGVCISD